MICKNCGSQLEEGAKFCGLCGTKVEAEPVSDVQPVIEPVSDVQPVIEPVSDVQPVIEPVSDVQPVVEPVSDVQPVIDSVLDVQPVIEPVVNNDTNIISNVSSEVSDFNDFNGGSKKSGKKFLVIIVLLIVISLLLGGIYYYLNNKKRIVSGLINSLYSSVESLYSDDNFDIKKDSFLISGDLSVSTNIQELSNLNGEKIGYNLGLDYPNKKLELGASLNENGVKIIDGNIYVLSDSSYLSIKDAFDGIINLDSYGFDEVFTFDFSDMNSSQDDIKYVIKAYKDILIDSLDMNDFKKSNDTISVDGKDVKVKKLSYELNDQRMKSLVSNISEGMLKDSKLLDILSKMSGVSVENLKSSLEQTKNANISYLNGRSVTFDIYTKGFDNSFVGMDIAGIIQIRKSEDSLNINVGIGTQSVNIVIKKVSNDSYTVSINTNINGENIKVDLTMSSTKIDDKNSSGSTSLSINYAGQKFNLTDNYKVSIGSKVSDVDVSGAKSINAMNDDELNGIISSITARVEDSKIYEFISGFTNGNTGEVSDSQDMDLILGE